MAIQEGDIVTVISKDVDFSGQQGEVVEVSDSKDDPPITVDFGGTERHAKLTHHPNRWRIQFDEDNLRVDSNWTPINRAFRLFGSHMWHSLSTVKKPLDLESACLHEGCGEKVASRYMVNIYGSVFEVDLCEVHGEKFHGKNIESFPWKKEEAVASPN